MTESATEDNASKILAIVSAIRTDFEARDLKWTLFVAAAQSYRSASLLKPFPPKYTNGDKCNIEPLVSAIGQTPPLQVVLRRITYDGHLNSCVVDFLHWVLVEHPSPALKSIETDFAPITHKAPFTQRSPRPTHMFEVVYPSNSKGEKVFEEYAEKFGRKFAFHGSKIDSFHSILTHGLNQHLCKSALFDEGIYLSSELSVSLNFSPYGAAWGGSAIGSHLSAVALCEYIEHPEHASFYVHTNKRNKVPGKYTIITNNDTVRIRYLLVFANKPVMNPPTLTNVALKWIIRHKFSIGISIYMLMLVSIGFANNKSYDYVKHIVERKLSTVYNLFKKIF